VFVGFGTKEGENGVTVPTMPQNWKFLCL
jgi:hypothetical protein